MKKLITMVIMVLAVVVAMAQAPEKLTYQAVVRSANNALVTNTLVGVRVSILQGSATGSGVYVETQMPSTNANGLITLNIGDGNAIFGTFGDIDWSAGPYFLKTEIDPTGGNSYSVTSTQQLLSVPYALYAKEAGNSFSGDYNDLTNTPAIPTVPTNVSAFTNDAGYITSQDIPAIPTVPTNVSAFTNDAGYITGYTETDPTVPVWAKEANKPTYNYSEIVNTPTIPTVPTNVSAFTNDAGYLTGYAETDPTVPAWAKTADKPTYNYSEIVNTPTIPTVPTNVSAFANDAGYITTQDIPTIPTVPTNVSAFTNDAGYLTGYTETDPTVPAWAKEANKPTYNYSEIVNTPTIPTVPTNVSAFTNDAGYLTEYTEQQVLSFSNDTLFLTGGSYVKLPAGFDGDYNSLTNKPMIPEVPANVSAFNNDAGYITGADIPAIPTVPTNVSAFTNDAGYLTEYSEQQVLTISNDTISLTGGSFVKLPAAAVGFSGDYNDLTNKPTIPTVPTNVSAFTNDAGYLTNYTETDPQFNSWNKDYNDLTNKPVLFDGDYNSLTNQPTIPTVPTNVSAFANDAGYLTGYTETDPTVPAWAKEANKPTYDYSEIANTPVIPTVPTDVSAFTNDVGYLTSYTETDPQFNAWNKSYNDLINTPTNVSAFANDAQYITSEAIPTQVSAFDNDAEYITIAAVPTQVSAFNNDAQYITAEAIPTQVSAFTNDAEYITIAAVPTQVSAFENDALYITEGELQQTVNVINNTFDSVDNVMNDMDNTIDSLRHRIDELEGHHTPPTVMTTGVADVSYLSATVNGSVVYIGGAPVAAKGFCYDTVMHPTVESATVSCGSGSGSFSANLLNLNSSTTYYVRAYATNMWGTNYGEEKVFTTLTEHAPSLEIVPATEVSFTSFTCGGDVTDSGTYAVTARGLCWATTPDPVMTGEHLHLGNGIGVFSASLTNLQPETTYYVRAYAVNAVGVTYSTPITVNTLTPQVPTVTTDSVSMYNECLATVVSDGGAPILQRGFCYDTLPNPTLESGVVTVEGSVGEFIATLSGLPIGKLYFVRAFATNAKGTTYGNQFDFYAGCDMKTLTDYDGNVYNTVLIGNQCWMKENLRTTHYSDGWPIEHGLETSYDVNYYYYPGVSSSNVFNEENVNLFGLLYNWKATMRDDLASDSIPSAVQGVCPTGWHVPSYAELTVLMDYVKSQYLCGENVNNIAKALCDSVGWSTPSSTSNACAIGVNVEENNATGFSLKGAGTYSPGVSSSDAYKYAAIWSCSYGSYSSNNRHGMKFDYSSATINKGGSGYSTGSGFDAKYGFSVRCLRDY